MFISYTLNRLLCWVMRYKILRNFSSLFLYKLIGHKGMFDNTVHQYHTNTWHEVFL